MKTSQLPKAAFVGQSIMAVIQKPKLTLAEVQRFCLDRGIQCLATEYRGRHHAISCKCMTCGREWSPRFGKILAGQGCRECSQKRRARNQTTPLEELRPKFLELGLDVIEEFRITKRRRRFRFRCLKCGDVFPGDPYSIRYQKSGCKKCAAKINGERCRLKLSDVDNRLRSKGLIRLSEFHSTSRKMSVRYDVCGHELKMTHNSIMRAEGCPKCAGHVRITEEEYSAVAEQFNGAILEIGKRVDQNSRWRCAYGHQFCKPLSQIKYTGRFCPKCFTSVGEELTRVIAERLLGVQFRKCRLRELRGDSRYPLELDIYNSRLRLAIEHHGEQHFHPQRNWGGEKAFEAITIRDQERRDGCKKLGITLLEVRSLDGHTSLEDFRKQLKRACLANGIEMAADFSSVELEDIKNKLLIPERVRNYDDLHAAAVARGYTLLEELYRGSQVLHRFRCPNGHLCKIKPNKFLNRRGCTQCPRVAHNKVAVQIQNVGRFDSITLAAAHLGVSDGTLCSAIKRGSKCRGFIVTKCN